MKQLIMLLIILSLLLSACSTTKPNNIDSSNTNTETQSSTTDSTSETTITTDGSGETGSTETTQGTESIEGTTTPSTGHDDTEPTQGTTVPTTEPTTKPSTEPTTTPTTTPTGDNNSGADGTDTTTPPPTESTPPPETAPVTPTLVINTPNNTELNIGESLQLDYTYSGDKSKLSWTSVYPDKVFVDQNGKVTAKSSGNSIITVEDGTITRRINIRVKDKAALPPTTSIETKSFNAPLSDGVVKYAGDYMTFQAYPLPIEGSHDLSVISSNSSVVSVSCQKNSSDITVITLNFKSAGSSVVTLKSADGAVSKSYTITVKSGYDFNPGSGQLTPEQWADYCTRVMVANGFTKKTNINSYRVLTLSASELTFGTAQEVGQTLVHSWWIDGCRKCWISYEGTDDNGDYVFYTRWAH